MKTKYKILIALTLVVVFGLGVAAGVLGERYVVHQSRQRAMASRPHMPSPEDWAKELGLTQEQQDKIHAIFKGNEERMKAYRADRRASASRPPWPSPEEWAKMLGLTQEQQDKIHEIFKKNDERMKAFRADSHDKLGDLRKQLKDEIDAVLTPEQRQKNDEMIRRFEEWRKKESERNPSRGRRDDGSQPPADRQR